MSNQTLCIPKAYAISELMRSYAVYGFLEIALWVSKWLMLYSCFVSFSGTACTEAFWQAHCSCIDRSKAVSASCLVETTESKLTKQYYLLLAKTLEWIKLRIQERETRK